MAAQNEWLRLFEQFIADIRIVSKEVVSDDPRGVPLVLWEGQRRFLKEVGSGLDAGIHQFNCLKSRQLGVCLHPETRVLTADLRWVPIAELVPGDEVVAVDEYGEGGVGNHRKMRTATVQAAIEVFHPAYRITFDDGRSVVCTKEHPWLTRKPTGTNTAWTSIEPRKALKLNDPTRLKIGYQVRWVTKPWGESTVEDGWFGGMLDGEGSISNENRTGVAIMACQRRGPVFDRLWRYAEERGYSANIESDTESPALMSKFGNRPCPKVVFTRQDEIFRLIGQTRPTRFIHKRFWEGRELPGKRSGIGWATITAIEELPAQGLVDLQTTTGTYIAEGFVSHNTTVSLGIDVFWLAMHDNIISAIVTDTEANRDANRALIRKYVNSFDDGYFSGSFQIVDDNRTMMTFSNGAQIRFLVAGTKKKSIAWAEGTGFSMLHFTEVSKYANPDGVKSLLEGFAQTNPNRLLIMESTANGYNHWKSRWEQGATDPYVQRSFFIGWWSGDTNRIERSDPRFKQWGKFPPDKDEREKIAAVAKLYNWHVTPEQLCWIRWKEGNAGADQDLHQQNQPWTHMDAFVQSGRSFFAVRMINKDLKKMDDSAKANEDIYRYKGYRYVETDRFLDFYMEEETEDKERIELKVWEEPVATGKYVIGFDVAYGRNDHKDGNAISVWRCYAGCIVQVAEYATYGVDVRYASWVFFHLTAAYGDVMGNIEIGGPGRLVMQEFQHLRELLGAEHNSAKVKARNWEDAAANARYYLYHKPDSMGAGYIYNFETNWSTKPRLMHGFASSYVTNCIEPRSRKLLDEMMIVQVDEDGGIGAPDSRDTDEKDDRVFAAALAHLAWIDWIRRDMLSQGLTFERVTKEERGEVPKAAKVVDGIVYRFLAKQEELANEDPPRGTAFQIKNGLV